MLAPENLKKDYVYVLDHKADHQGRELPITVVRWTGPYIVENILPNNKNLARKNGMDKTQVLHYIRLRMFTPRQPIPDVQTTPQEWKPGS